MFEIILLLYLSARNSARAKRKGLNGITWALITAALFVVTLIIGTFVVVFGFCADKINLQALSTTDLKVRAALTQQLVQVLNDNPLHLITIELFGLGGYLLVRYILDRKPDLKEPEEKPSEYIS